MATPPVSQAMRVFRQATLKEAAAFFQVDSSSVRNWSMRGAPVKVMGSKTSPWEIDLYEMAKWYLQVYKPPPPPPAQQPVSSGPVDPETLDPAERKHWYDGEIRRRDLEVRDRKLIPAVELEAALGVAYNAVAQTLLSLPDWLERRVGLPSDALDATEAIVREAMVELNSRLKEVAPFEEGRD